MVKPEADKEKDDEGLHYRKDAAGRSYLYGRLGNRVYKNPHKDTLRPPTIKREDWVKMGKDARKELSDYFAEKAAKPAAPARSGKKRTHLPMQRTAAQVATFICSVMTFFGGASGEIFDQNGADDSSSSEDDVNEDDLTQPSRPADTQTTNYVPSTP